MSKSEGPRLPSPGSDAGSDATGTPAHTKHEPLSGADYVRFKPPGARCSFTGYVLAPEGGPLDAEITGDSVRIQEERTARLYTVPRSNVKALHGRALDQAKEKNDKPRRLADSLKNEIYKDGPGEGEERQAPPAAAQQAREAPRRPLPSHPHPVGDGPRRRPGPAASRSLRPRVPRTGQRGAHRQAPHTAEASDDRLDAAMSFSNDSEAMRVREQARGRGRLMDSAFRR
jgi:hypothetical protein